MPILDTPKNPAPQDWHPADIVAAIWKRGTSLTRLSRQSGYARNALQMALRRPWPKAEKIIADFLGLSPQTIWPSRYYDDGAPKSGRGIGRPGRPFSHPTTGSPRAVIRRRRTA